ncbi:MAG: radical SAM protein [Deltaproteobacteria bacterium]|nr:radical SAM protein [Deltaproteobacteria bacterium]
MSHPSFLLELTHRCDLSCAYCYGPWKSTAGYPQGELPTSRLKELIDQLIDDAAPRSITLMGGEPLLSEHLLEIASAVAKRQVKVGLSTHGRALDRALADRLVRAGVGHFELSLDTIDAALCARLTGGRVDDVVRAIGAVRSSGATCTLSAVLTRPILPGLPDLLGFAFALGVSSVSLLRPVGCNVPADLLPTDDELLEAVAKADETAAQTGLQLTLGIPLEPCLFDRKRFPHVLMAPCGGSTDKWTIDPMGNLRICEASPEIVGSLLSSRFGQLSVSPAVQRFRASCRQSDCLDCSWLDSCRGGCRQARR